MRTFLSAPVLAALLCGLLSACSDNFGNGSDDGTTGTGSDTGGANLGGTGAADELPSLEGLVDPSGCEELSGEAVAGAAAFFIGIYETTSGGEWVGLEEYRLYANEAWKQEGGQDCSVFWRMSASESSPGACGSCELGLAVNAELDQSSTTCPAALYSGEETFSVSYGIDLRDAGTAATWYFAGTGNRFGEGYAVGDPDAVNFLSDHTCQWFGR